MHRAAMKKDTFSEVIEIQQMKVKMNKEEKNRNSAMSKISWAASNFGGKKDLLAGFKQADMTKAEFQEQLRRAFGVRLNQNELQVSGSASRSDERRHP